MSVAKNCVDVWTCLFDHKPFLQSELNSFVNEFEEKRQDREIVNLLDVLNIECEVSNQIDTISCFDSAVLKSLNEKVIACVRQTDDILKCDKCENEKSRLELRRKERETSWLLYKDGMEPKYAQFDEKLEKEVDQLRKFFENKSNRRK